MPVILRLNAQHIMSIRAHAEHTYPEECCGLLLGKSDPTGKTVMEVKATKNGSEERDRKYQIAPEEMLAVMKGARSYNLDIIGIYHSHPDHPAIPSERDRAAAWSQYSYAIVSVLNGISEDLQSWSLDDRQVFQSETVLITS